MAKYSLDQIKEAYIQKKDWEKQFPLTYFVVRPLSFYVTCLVIRISESAPIVVGVGFIIAVLGCVSLVFMSYLSPWPGIVLLAIFSLLDTVDGNIARVTNKVSYYGRYLDGMVGVLIDACYFFFLGLGVYLMSGRSNPWIFLAGIIIMAARFYGNIAEVNYDYLTIQKQKQEGKFQETLHKNVESSTYRQNPLYLLFINLNTLNVQLLALAICAALNIIDLFLLLYALYYLVRILVITIFYLHQARVNLWNK